MSRHSMSKNGSYGAVSIARAGGLGKAKKLLTLDIRDDRSSRRSAFLARVVCYTFVDVCKRVKALSSMTLRGTNGRETG